MVRANREPPLSPRQTYSPLALAVTVISEIPRRVIRRPQGRWRVTLWPNDHHRPRCPLSVGFGGSDVIWLCIKSASIDMIAIVRFDAFAIKLCVGISA